MDVFKVQKILAARRLSYYRKRVRRGIDVLTLDWDAWTGDCSGIEHKCCGFCRSRGCTRKGRGELGRLRECSCWKTPEEFVTQEIGHPLAVIVTECHADIAFFLSAIDQVINVDNHDDSSNFENLCCGSWASMIFPTKYVHVPDPQHLDRTIKRTWEGCADIVDFNADVVIMCLSSPWTPKKLDFKFFELVRHVTQFCQVKEPAFFGHRARSLKRRYSELVSV